MCVDVSPPTGRCSRNSVPWAGTGVLKGWRIAVALNLCLGMTIRRALPISYCVAFLYSNTPAAMSLGKFRGGGSIFNMNIGHLHDSHENRPFSATLSLLVLRAQRSTGAETLQMSRSYTKLSGKIEAGPNELMSVEQDSKTLENSPSGPGALFSTHVPASELLFKLRMLRNT